MNVARQMFGDVEVARRECSIERTAINPSLSSGNVKMQGARENAARQMQRYKDADALRRKSVGFARRNGVGC